MEAAAHQLVFHLAERASKRPRYEYAPSKAAAAIFVVLFAGATILHLYQLFRTRTWYSIPFVIGGLLEVIGYVGRMMNTFETAPNWTLGPYIIQALGTLLAPALFAASIYMVLGRVVLLTDGESYAIIRKRWSTKLFVIGDIASFVIQALGGGMLSKGTADSASKGQKTILIGLFIQILFFALFIASALVFHRRLNALPTRQSTHVPWLDHIYVLYAASILIMIRSVYHVIEYAIGRDGELMKKEVYLYILDAVLMFVMMVLFNVWHPSEVGSLYRGGKVAELFGVRSVEKVRVNEDFVELTGRESA